jgi:hypothetical protein
LGKFTTLVFIIFIGIAARFFVPAVFANESRLIEETEVVQQVQAITPLSIQMVEASMKVLSEDWSGMSPAEQEAFLNLFDPARTGDIDEQFLQSVINNFQRIRRALDKNIKVKYVPDNDLCVGERLYYTDLISLHVCPYFLTEKNDIRKARTLIHEYAHITLKVRDRPYFVPDSEFYAELTPRGSWMSLIPGIGPVFREILANDTLYHPDAYAHYSAAMSGQPGYLEYYLNIDIPK